MEDIILKDTNGNFVDLNEVIHDYIKKNLTVNFILSRNWAKVEINLNGELICESEDSTFNSIGS